MAFFLIERDRTEGSLRLLSVESFATREEALRAVAGLFADGADAVDVFVCDLDAATPIVFLPQAAQATPEEPASVSEATASETVETEFAEPAVGVWEAPVPEPVPGHASEAAEEMEPVAEEPEEAASAEAPGLADALRRAATSMEADGIVAPESVGGAAPSEECTELDDEPDVAPSSLENDLAAAIASLGLEAPAPEEETPSALEEEAPSEWPWANVEPVEATPESPDVPEEIELDEIEMIEDSLAEVQSAAIEDTEDALADLEPSEIEETPGEVVTESAEDEVALAESLEETVVAEAASDITEGSLEEATPESVEETADEAVPQAAERPGAYEAGELALSEYTCEDCVYANTCPKAGSSTPAECGSFQWRS